MANRITMARIVLLPLLILFLRRETPLLAFLALVTFVFLAITDWVDGYVARNLGQVTATGKLLDPIADKLLVTAALLPLTARGEIPAWIGVVILGREFVVTGLRMIAASEQRIIAAGQWGKYKTIVLIVALSVIIAKPVLPFLSGLLDLVGTLGLWAGMVLAVVSGVEYFVNYTPSEPSGHGG